MPLGITIGVGYETTTVRLEPVCRFTFYSDGVIEAQDEHGKLFGFDRLRELSMESAPTIVAKAKAFGQEDDITVISVERVAVEKESEARHAVILAV